MAGWLAGWLAAQQLRHTCEQAVSSCLKDPLANQHHGIGSEAPQPQGTLAALASEASMPAYLLAKLALVRLRLEKLL